MAPVRAVDHYIENALITMKDAYVYKSGTLDMVKPEDRAYFEYITKEFKQVPQEAIAQKIKFFTYIDLVNFFVSYFLFG